MKIDFKDAKKGDYLYWFSEVNKHYAIGQILVLHSYYGYNYLYGKVLESNFLAINEKISFEIDKCLFFTNKSDIDKILIFK